jgi:hypothetical protein
MGDEMGGSVGDGWLRGRWWLSREMDGQEGDG